MPRIRVAPGLSSLVSLLLASLVILQLVPRPESPVRPGQEIAVREPGQAAPARHPRQLSGILLPPPPVPAPARPEPASDAAPALPAVMPDETALGDPAEAEADLQPPARTPDERVRETVSHVPAPEQAVAPAPEQRPAIKEPAVKEPAVKVPAGRARRETAAPPSPAPPSLEPPEQQGPVAVVSREVAGQGRALLRILEHGSGPSVEIAWPNDPSVRSRLYRELAGCYGMRLALMDRGGLLYAAEQAPGESWPINLDRYSGFVRQPSGALTPDERRKAKQIRAHHRGLGGHVAVRIFPRGVDALLLGGLRQLVGRDYPSLGSIRAAYQFEGRKLQIGKLIVDGRPLAGRIDLSRARRRC